MTMDQDTMRTPADQPPPGAPPRPDDAPVYVAPAQPVVPTPVAPGPVVPANQPPKRRASRLLDIALAGAAIIAIGGVAFAVGRATAPAPAQAARAFDGNGGFFRNGGSFDPGAVGGNGQGPRFAFGGAGTLAIDGTVASISADSMTVKTANGQDVTVQLDGSTAYHQASAASSSDVAVGDDVTVRVQGGRGPITASPSEPPRFSASDVTVTH